MGTVYNCPFRTQVKKIRQRAEDKMLFFALSVSTLLLAVSADDGYGESGYGSDYTTDMYYGSGYGSEYGSMYEGYGEEETFYNDTWGGSGYGGYGGSGYPWPEAMHCCMCKSVGYYKYWLVDYHEAEQWKKEGMRLPRRCYNGCIYTMDGDDSGDLYCFARGRQDVMCYDEYLEGYGSGSMGYGSGMGSGYGMGSGMGSGYGMGSGMGSGYGMEHGYGSEGYGSDY